jgi:hypothetical protein
MHTRTKFLNISKWANMCFKIKVKRSSLRLGSFPKLAARYHGPFELLEKIGLVAYIITFYASMRVHNVFHVSLLNKYVPEPTHIIDFYVI